MAEHPTIKWTGASKKEYKYYIWELPAHFEEDQDGNYIFSRLNSNNRWVPAYIGQGDLKIALRIIIRPPASSVKGLLTFMCI